MDSGRIVDFGALIGSNPSLSSGESSANLTSSHAAEAAARDTLRSFAQIGSGQTNARSGNRKSGAVARRDAKRCSSSAWAERSWALVNDTNGKDERRHSLSAERPNFDRGSSACLHAEIPGNEKKRFKEVRSSLWVLASVAEPTSSETASRMAESRPIQSGTALSPRPVRLCPGKRVRQSARYVSPSARLDRRAAIGPNCPVIEAISRSKMYYSRDEKRPKPMGEHLERSAPSSVTQRCESLSFTKTRATP